MAMDDKMPKWAQDHFKDPDPNWTPIVIQTALSTRVLAVAQTRREGKWAAYIDAVPGIDHVTESDAVLRLGQKLEEAMARILFPSFNDIPYAP